ncbi:lipase family protein, partial [Rhodococcus aerolatus]
DPAAAAPAAAAAEAPAPGDPFFAAPEGLADLAPGQVVRSRPVRVVIYGIFPVPAHQLVYRSTDTAGRPVAAVTTVVLPTGPPTGPRPLVSYQAAINSLDPDCSPSRLLPAGRLSEQLMVAFMLLRGWAVALPDHEGPAAAYSAGRLAAQVTLDGIRAVQSFAPAGTAGPGSPVGLWGYSGGGLATAWTAELARSYAPELDVVGAAAGGVPVDFGAIVAGSDGSGAFGLLFAAAAGLAREYPGMEMDTLLNDRGKALVQTMSGECVEGALAAGNGLSFDELSVSPGAVGTPGVQAALADNSLGQAVPTMPVLLYHSVNDTLIPTAGADALNRTYCDGGGTVEYQKSPITDHVQVAVFAIGNVLRFLDDRFAGRPPVSTC